MARPEETIPAHDDHGLASGCSREVCAAAGHVRPGFSVRDVGMEFSILLAGLDSGRLVVGWPSAVGFVVG